MALENLLMVLESSAFFRSDYAQPILSGMAINHAQPILSGMLLDFSTNPQKLDLFETVYALIRPSGKALFDTAFKILYET